MGALRDPDHLSFPEAYRKAARIIANEFIRPPKDRKTGYISFPSIFFDKDKMLTDAEKKRRKIGFDVWQRVKAGDLVTHAIAAVAAQLHYSPQKVTKDYYDWKGHFDALERLASGGILENSK